MVREMGELDQGGSPAEGGSYSILSGSKLLSDPGPMLREALAWD